MLVARMLSNVRHQSFTIAMIKIMFGMRLVLCSAMMRNANTMLSWMNAKMVDFGRLFRVGFQEFRRSDYAMSVSHSVSPFSSPFMIGENLTHQAPRAIGGCTVRQRDLL